MTNTEAVIWELKDIAEAASVEALETMHDAVERARRRLPVNSYESDARRYTSSYARAAVKRVQQAAREITRAPREEFFSLACDMVERAWQHWPVDSHKYDFGSHTSRDARAAAVRITDAIIAAGVAAVAVRQAQTRADRRRATGARAVSP